MDLIASGDFEHAVARLIAAEATVSTAESLTGGQVAAVLTAVPGSSEAYVGGVIAYATEVKVNVLGVPTEIVEQYGVVSQECARAMAQGVRRMMGTTYGLATTGVAGPAEQEGKPAGTVFVAVAGPDGVEVSELALPGSRVQVQVGSVEAVLGLLGGILHGEEPVVG